MNLVNNAEGSFYILDHSPWDGITIADFVMPFFLFIVGMSISLAYKGPLSRGAPKFDMFKKAATRTIKLYLIFLALKLPNMNLKRLRVLGVLPRIAICYIIATCTAIFIPKMNIKTSFMKAIFPYVAQYAVAVGILVLYIGLMFGLPVPGCERPGMMTPSCNAAGYIDEKVSDSLLSQALISRC